MMQRLVLAIAIMLFSIGIKAQAVDTTFVSVGKVQIEGNKRTKNFIIERELDIKAGVQILKSDLQERLLQNQKRIFNTTLFSEVIVAYTSAIDNEINILITVKENWYLWAFPYASFNDRNFNEWRNRGSDFGRLNYGFFVDHKNFLGRMQKLEFVFETGFTNRVTLRYNIPYLNKSGKNGLYSEFKYQNLANLNYTTKNNQLEFVYADEQLKNVGDWLVWLKILIAGKIAYTSECLNNFRYHSESVIAKAVKNTDKTSFNDWYCLAMRKELTQFLKKSKTKFSKQALKINACYMAIDKGNLGLYKLKKRKFIEGWKLIIQASFNPTLQSGFIKKAISLEKNN